MIESPSKYLSDYLLLPESYEKMAVIDSCYAAINEAAATNRIVDITDSYTFGMILEILEAAKNQLISIQEALLSYFNNYILNTANLADKYRDLIIERLGKLRSPIIYRTYSYHKLFDKSYPALIKATNTDLVSSIEEFQNHILDESLNADQQGEIIDHMLEDFAYRVIETPVDPTDLKSSVDKAVRDVLRGREQIRTLDSKSLSKFIDEIAMYKPTKDALARTKKAMLDDYATLKSTYTAAMKKKEAASVGIASIKDPEFVRFNRAEADRFATINMNMTRLFNGYITIYREVFDTKMEVLREKIDSNRAIIIKLLTETGLLAVVNSKNPSKERRPLAFDPKLIKPKPGTNA